MKKINVYKKYNACILCWCINAFKKHRRYIAMYNKIYATCNKFLSLHINIMEKSFFHSYISKVHSSEYFSFIINCIL